MPQIFFEISELTEHKKEPNYNLTQKRNCKICKADYPTNYFEQHEKTEKHKMNKEKLENMRQYIITKGEPVYFFKELQGYIINIDYNKIIV